MNLIILRLSHASMPAQCPSQCSRSVSPAAAVTHNRQPDSVSAPRMLVQKLYVLACRHVQTADNTSWQKGGKRQCKNEREGMNTSGGIKIQNSFGLSILSHSKNTLGRVCERGLNLHRYKELILSLQLRFIVTGDGGKHNYEDYIPFLLLDYHWRETGDWGGCVHWWSKLPHNPWCTDWMFPWLPP